MTPGARLQASIEVLDSLASSAAPADRALKAWGKANRYAGSGDRRAVSERVFTCLRERGRLAAAMGAEDGRALVIGSLALIDRLDIDEVASLLGGAHAPSALTGKERERLAGVGQGDSLGLPPFVETQLQGSFGDAWPQEAAALLRGRAPLDIRLNGQGRQGASGLPPCEPTPWSARGLRFDGSPDLVGLPEFAAGLFEVQDEGSQIAAFLAGGGQVIVDYCAGGGGKTLALAQAHPARLVACDVERRRLDAIKPRLQRAGVAAELRAIGPLGEGAHDLVDQADLVLVDAPCSGSGTWRRRPEAAWRLSEEEIARLADLQQGILSRASRLVKPGGRLAYVTCSVLDAENGQVAKAFAAAHPHFAPLPIARAAQTHNLTEPGRQRLAALSQGGHTVQLSPRRTATDGFFIALFERSA